VDTGRVAAPLRLANPVGEAELRAASEGLTQLIARRRQHRDRPDLRPAGDEVGNATIILVHTH